MKFGPPLPLTPEIMACRVRYQLHPRGDVAVPHEAWNERETRAAIWILEKARAHIAACSGVGLCAAVKVSWTNDRIPPHVRGTVYEMRGRALCWLQTFAGLVHEDWRNVHSIELGSAYTAEGRKKRLKVLNAAIKYLKAYLDFLT